MAPPWKLVAITVAAAILTACGGDGGDDRAAPPSPLSPSPTPEDYRPPPGENPANPLLINYCAGQDAVVTLEGQLLSRHIPVPAMAARMHEAQRVATRQARMFAAAGRERLAHLARAWATSFRRVRVRLHRGMRPIDALRPAIGALGDLESVFTCDLDA